jgi:hypothetical protein
MDDPVGAPLSIELASWRDDPITGTVSLGPAPGVAFVGWVGLITAVERLREAIPLAGDLPAPPPGA